VLLFLLIKQQKQQKATKYIKSYSIENKAIAGEKQQMQRLQRIF
jgi:hypothetical protein